MKIDIENLRVVGELTHKYIHIFFYYKMNNARKNLPYYSIHARNIYENQEWEAF